MPPKGGGVTGNSTNTGSSNNPFHEPNDALLLQQQQQWVNVTWMPHTALSQTSHVCLTIHSAQVVLLNEDGTFLSANRSSNSNSSTIENVEWRIQMSIHGIGNVPLAPISTHTQAATVMRRTTRDHLPSSTSSTRRIITIQKATHECHWDSFTYLPLRWRDLTRDSYLLIEIARTTSTDKEDEDVVMYHTTIPFFTQYGKLETGLQKLKLRHGPLTNPTNRNYGLVRNGTANCKKETSDDDDDPVWKSVLILDQLERMETAERGVQERIHTNSGHNNHHPMNNNMSKNGTLHTDINDNYIANNTFGRIPSVPWLDTMMKERAIQEIQDDYCVDTADLLLLDSSHAFLIIEFPQFEIPVLYEEAFYPMPQHGACGAVSPIELAAFRKRTGPIMKNLPEDTNYFDPLQLVSLLDYENENDNPVEDKYRTLAHDLLRGLVDPALKPDREQRNRLANIIDSPSHHPTREEKDLLWRFRFSLVDNRRALTKFLLAVDWTMESEVVQAAELLEQWRRRSPIEVTDALKLLGKNVAFQTNLVRDYAIDTLAAAPDSELRLYLLQLVQALKYENVQRIETLGVSHQLTNGVERVSSLATFLINRAAGNIELANYLYWYLKVEIEDPTFGARYREVFAALEVCLSQTPFSTNTLRPTQHILSTPEDVATQLTKSIVDSVSKLGSSLRKVDIHGSTNDNDKTIPGEERTMWGVLVEQDKFISGVLDLQLRCRDLRGKKDAKEAELRNLLAKEGFDRKDNRDPVPLPSRPDIFVNGVRPETAIMFKSALYPALLEFHVEGTMPTKDHDVDCNFTSYRVIVKTGDDLRQDQLIIMMIQLMDGLLKRGALDLCLTPYSIIATSTTSGLVEFVDKSMPISQVLSKFNGSIMQFLQSVASQKGAKYDIQPDVLSTYIRSCAGYCVITYLLGVGDRHLDNIMLRTTGHFFHIDFGFIFGRDPKPLPPAFRLTREMVDGMGGFDSNEYRQFCSLACQAYNALRKSAGLVLNLLNLMSDAGIEDLSNNASADAEGVIAKVEERFRLDLNDEQAERFFIGLINDCLSAIAPRVMDVFHSIAVARR